MKWSRFVLKFKKRWVVRLDVCGLRSYIVSRLEVFERGQQVFILSINFNKLETFSFLICNSH